MCISLVQSLFNIGLFVALLFTLLGLVTPGWKSITVEGNNTISSKEGIVTLECSRGMIETLKEKVADDTSISDGCKFKWDTLPSYQKAVIALLIMSIIASGACLIWSCLTTFMCCLCCLKAYLLYPLPVVLGFCALFNLIAVAVYGAKHTAFDEMFSGDDLEKAHEGIKEKYGYSFALALLGGLGYAICSVLMCCLIKLNKVMPL